MTLPVLSALQCMLFRRFGFAEADPDPFWSRILIHVAVTIMSFLYSSGVTRWTLSSLVEVLVAAASPGTGKGLVGGWRLLDADRER